jgi:serine/threonine protein kinase
MIGKGGFGNVFNAIRKNEQQTPVIVKKIFRLRVDYTENIPSEVFFLKKAQTIPGVVTLLDHILGPIHLYLIFPQEQCIDLYTFIEQNFQTIAENLAQKIFVQCVQIVVQLQEIGILHTDLKDENYIYNVPEGKIKLIDFGGAQTFHSGLYHEFPGTRVYVCPEFLENHCYTAEGINTWSLGTYTSN